jgi:hypothetical protein
MYPLILTTDAPCTLVSLSLFANFAIIGSSISYETCQPYLLSVRKSPIIDVPSSHLTQTLPVGNMDSIQTHVAESRLHNSTTTNMPRLPPSRSCTCVIPGLAVPGGPFPEKKYCKLYTLYGVCIYVTLVQVLHIT